MSATPYENLTPELILAAVESAGFTVSGSLFALNSFENRVYQIGLDDDQFIIAKFYRPGRWSDAAILEEHEFMLELAEREIPVIPPLPLTNGSTLATYADYRFALFTRQGGRSLELSNLEHLEWMGRAIGRIHAVGQTRRFQHRLTLNVETYGEKPYAFLRDNGFVPESLRHNYYAILEHNLLLIRQCYQKVGEVNLIRVHGDCHIGNVLVTPEGLKLVDFDDCLQAPAIQDLWMLLTGETEAIIEQQLQAILTGYQEFMDFDYRELRLIEALRTLRMIHYSGWLAKRWEDPAFPRNFPWFNTPRYWEDQLQQLREQAFVLEALLNKDDDLPDEENEEC